MNPPSPMKKICLWALMIVINVLVAMYQLSIYEFSSFGKSLLNLIADEGLICDKKLTTTGFLQRSQISLKFTVADPGFPVGGHQPIGGASDAGTFSRKCMRKRKIWVLLGVGAPMDRANGSGHICKHFQKIIV